VNRTGAPGPPSARQAASGVIIWIGVGLLFLFFRNGETDDGNLLFLAVAATVCFGFALWRVTEILRAARRRT
jgi:hypothetical protein